MASGPKRVAKLARLVSEKDSSQATVDIERSADEEAHIAHLEFSPSFRAAGRLSGCRTEVKVGDYEYVATSHMCTVTRFGLFVVDMAWDAKTAQLIFSDVLNHRIFAVRRLGWQKPLVKKKVLGAETPTPAHPYIAERDVLGSLCAVSTDAKKDLPSHATPSAPQSLDSKSVASVAVAAAAAAVPVGFKTHVLSGPAVEDTPATHASDPDRDLYVPRRAPFMGSRGIADFGHADGPGASARFHQPRGIAIRGRKLLVCDSQNACIRSVSLATGACTTLVGAPDQRVFVPVDGRGSCVRFAFPTHIVVNPHRATSKANAFVLDVVSIRVLKGDCVSTLVLRAHACPSAPFTDFAMISRLCGDLELRDAQLRLVPHAATCRTCIIELIDPVKAAQFLYRVLSIFARELIGIVVEYAYEAAHDSAPLVPANQRFWRPEPSRMRCRCARGFAKRSGAYRCFGCGGLARVYNGISHP